MTDQKRCPKCGETKHLTEFSKNRRHPDGLQTYCRVCNRAHVTAWQKANPEKTAAISRRTKRKQKYGISDDDYYRMLDEQWHCCKICGTPHREEAHGVLVVDHCHNTGKVRGLLCVTCNTGIGQLKDSLELVLKAADYLREHK
jgi:hypothetical protein